MVGWPGNVSLEAVYSDTMLQPVLDASNRSGVSRAFLDDVREDLLAGGLVEALDTLGASLTAARRALPADEWASLIQMCRSHPLRSVLHQDPLTARAFAMSRGYQGDAELLDIIYSEDYRGCPLPPVTSLGDAIFGYTIRCQAPAAVRARRRFLADQIDASCANRPGAEILSVACGHLRELEVSSAVRTRAFGRFVGLDRDPATLATVSHRWGATGVEARAASAELFMPGAAAVERFDLVYAAGLYDYLADELAQLVTARLFDFLKPGGRLLIGSFTPATRDAGYMEAYMGWELVYRDARAMRRFAEPLPQTSLAGVETVADETGAVVYLDVRAA